MKIKCTLVLSLLFAIPFSVSAADTRDHLAGLGSGYEFYGYFNISHFYDAFEKAGIPRADIAHYFGSDFVAAEEEFKTKYNITSNDFEDLAFAGSISKDPEGKSEPKIVFIFKPKKDILKEIDQSKDLIAGVPALTGVSPKENYCVIKDQGLIVMADRKTLETYLTTGRKSGAKNPKAEEFASLSKGKLWYLRWNLSDESKKTFREAFEKEKRAAFVKNNPYMQALYNIDTFEGGMDSDFSNIFLGIGSSRTEDAERLVMLSHCSIVIASFAVSYIYDTNQEQGAAGKGDADRIQDMLMRIHSAQRKNGVLLTFAMNDADRKIIVEKSKERIAKSKEETVGKRMEILFNSAIGYCEKGDLEHLRKTVASGLDVNYKDTAGRTLLTAACKESQAGAVKYLLDMKADPNAPTIDGDYPLHIAVENSNVIISELLVKAKADVSKLNYYGKSPLHIAAVKSVQMCTILVTGGANANVLTSSGDTPLHLSAANGAIDIVKYLLSIGADKSIQNDYGKIPADTAHDSGYTEIENLLRAK
jgi:ankyrin repeat protein